MPKFEVILNHKDRATGFVESSREFVHAETEGEVYDLIFPEPPEGDESEFVPRYITDIVSISEVSVNIYVDQLFDYGPKKGQWCHMMIDYDADLEILHWFASRIGLKREWFQDHDAVPHYDLRASKRKMAVIHGAIELTTPRDKMMKCNRRPEFQERRKRG